MTPPRETQITASRPEQLLKTFQMIGYAPSAVLARTISRYRRTKTWRKSLLNASPGWAR